MALGQLVNGQWSTDWTERSQSGDFQRMATQFRQQITTDGSSGFKAEPDRYHLYVSLGCPWAHRTVLLRQLKGLGDSIGLSIVDPVISESGWRFASGAAASAPGCIPDTVNGATYLWEIYVKAKTDYTGRVTVPVLWDNHTQTIVNNESRQIIQMLNSEFNAMAQHPDREFYPPALRPEIDAVLDAIYQPINNGVYRSGFASSQASYNQAVTELFTALDHWETVLQRQRYLVGDRITLADWCMFTTLFRFDLAYHGLFKTNLKRLVDYPNLWNYCRDLYQYPGVAEVCSIDHVQQLYYAGLPELNPNRIVPKGPAINFRQPHTRATLGG